MFENNFVVNAQTIDNNLNKKSAAVEWTHLVASHVQNVFRTFHLNPFWLALNH